MITIRKGTYRLKPTFFNALPYASTAGRRAATAAMRRKEISCAEKIYFRRTEKIFPLQRKFASAASQSDFVSLLSRLGANVRFSLDIAQTHILFCLDTKKYAKKVKAYATSRPAWCLLAKLRKLAYGSNNSLFSTLTSHSGYPVSLANAD